MATAIDQPKKYKKWTDLTPADWEKVKNEDDLRALVEPGGMPATEDDLKALRWKTIGSFVAGSLLGSVLISLWRNRK